MRSPAGDEVTYRRNTEAYERCDLVPYVLAGVESIDMLTTVMEQKLKMLLFCSPTAVVRFAGPGQAERGAASYATGPGNGSQFALDSPLEQTGFELSVPPRRRALLPDIPRA